MSAYDERLLASAPAATRAEKQEGYNVDLLDNPRDNASRSRNATPTPPPAVLAPNADYAEGQYPKESPGALLYSTHSQKPWYKTRKWLIIFTLLGIAVISAVIGGAVGGTLSNKHKDNGNNTAQSDPNAGSSSSGVSGADTGSSNPQSGGGQQGGSVSASSGQTTTQATGTGTTTSPTTTTTSAPGTEGGSPGAVTVAQPSEGVVAAAAIDGVV